MNQYYLRHFCDSDFSELMRLEDDTFPLDAYSPEMLRERISKYPDGFLVAVKRGKIVGYIAAWVLNGQARIDTMAVASKHQNEGIGSCLLKAALDHFTKKGYDTVELEVRPTNTVAIHLYEKFVFKIVDLKHRYYESDNSDALLMRRVTKG